MKKTLLTITLSIIAFFSYAQEITKEPIHKKTNTVLMISEKCNQQELFNKIVDILIKRGFGIRNLERDFMYFMSNEKVLELETFTISVCYEISTLDKYIKIRAIGNADKELSLEGYHRIGTNSKLGTPWEYRKRDPNNNGHARIYQDIVESINNLDVPVYVYYTRINYSL